MFQQARELADNFSMTFRRFLTSAAELLAFTAVFAAHSSYAQSLDEANSLLKAATEKYKPNEAGKARFTYREVRHQTNYKPNGKKTFDGTSLYETIFLYDKEYQRLLEINGKPLEGKTLEAEQKRYEEAVNRQNGLSLQQRAEQAHGRFANVNINFHKLLTLYDNRITRHEMIDGHECTVIESVPKSSAPDAPQRHVTIWIDEKNHEVAKVAFELLADEEGLLKGSSGWFTMKTIDGVAVDTTNHIDYLIADKKHKEKEFARVVTDSSFSDYKRFTSSSLIVPSDEDAPQQP